MNLEHFALGDVLHESVPVQLCVLFHHSEYSISVKSIVSLLRTGGEQQSLGTFK